MLRLTWGPTELELQQAEEILKLRAEVSDLHDALLAQATGHAQRLSDQHRTFLDFLRPSTRPSGASILPDPVVYPGDRPDTAPAYPEGNVWVMAPVQTAKAPAQ